MTDIDQVWERIRRHAGEEFRTVMGLPFTYDVPGNYLRLHRTNRSLSKTNFLKALPSMPADGPGAIRTGRDRPTRGQSSWTRGFVAATGDEPGAATW